MKKISEKFDVENYPQFKVYQLIFKPGSGEAPTSYDEASDTTYVRLSHKSALKFAKMILADAKKGKKK